MAVWLFGCLAVWLFLRVSALSAKETAVGYLLRSLVSSVFFHFAEQ
jgi:formate/nitrite transporter FocA (FNT family)